MSIKSRSIIKFIPQILRKRLPQEIKIVEIPRPVSRKLNQIYRNSNKVANVLSFRYGKDYGEILVCPEVLRKEAKAQGNSYKYQMTWMILHGILHLAELHHERSTRETKRVEALEGQILRKLFS